MTERQLRLFFRAALRHERRARADRIQDVNAGMAGGRPASELLRALTEPI
ncbi:MAG: hypothetical protein IAE86_06515 [Burkholderiaceae bacterium]|nr:hypothetical protein [Burkholderiaceae bacterium]